MGEAVRVTALDTKGTRIAAHTYCTAFGTPAGGLRTTRGRALVSPILIGGRPLGVESNGVFTDANTRPIPGGRLWPEAAGTWMLMHAVYVAGGGHPSEFDPGGPASSARSFAQQVSLKAHWVALGQPQKAAQPGTSNHGWAIAVDCPAARAQAWLMSHCGEYGWSHDEGARVGEPWHFRYIGAPAGLLRRLQRDPLAGYTATERRWIAEYDRLVTQNANPARRSVLRRVMTLQRKRLFKAAQDPAGWTPTRKRRYASLLERTR
ncbi:MAG: hypothetical protein QOH12_2173 [Solirubrobacteraceae bacterium]|jgi:hypothetical protein|nr:hypothetical protein [Solirubrobacteraceae bacterium]